MFILLSDERYVYKPIIRLISPKGQQKVKVKFSNDLVMQFQAHFAQQKQYLTYAAEAAFMSLNTFDKNKHTFHLECDLISHTGESINLQQNSTSVGLGYALSCAFAMREKLNKGDKITTELFVTGEVSAAGNILPVGDIVSKVNGALHAMKNMPKHLVMFEQFIIIYPAENRAEIPESLKQKVSQLGGQLLPVTHLTQALEQLLGHGYDGNLEQRAMTFNGLKSFDFYDQSIYFGRDEETAALASLYTNTQGMIKVYGVSGSGKSSLVKAGLLPTLAKANSSLKWQVFTPSEFTSSQTILKGLLTCSDAPLISTQFVTDDELNGLIEACFSSQGDPASVITPYLHDQHPVIWYIDQGEEIHSLNYDIKLLKVLDNLAREIPFLSVITSIRSEYLHHQSQLGEDYFLSHTLSPASWHSIINNQALSLGIKFQEGLIAHIQSQAIQMEHALPAVEYLMTQMHQLAIQTGSSKYLTFKHFEQVGGLLGVITQQAEQILTQHDKYSATFFEAFVGINHDMQPFAKHVDLQLIQTSNPALYDIILAFIDKQLVIKSGHNHGGQYVKLAHECLIYINQEANLNQQLWPLFFVWFVERKEYLLWLNHIESRFTKWLSYKNNQHKQKDFLLQKKELQEGNLYLNQVGTINQQAVRDFITTSQAYHNTKLEQQHKQQKKWTRIFFSLTLVSIMFAATTAYNYHKASQAQQKSQQLLSLVRQGILYNVDELAPFLKDYIPTKERLKVNNHIEGIVSHLDEMDLSAAERIRFYLIKLDLMQEHDKTNEEEINTLLIKIKKEVYQQHAKTSKKGDALSVLQAKLSLEFGDFLQIKSQRHAAVEYLNQGLNLLRQSTPKLITDEKLILQAKLLMSLGEVHIGTNNRTVAKRHLEKALVQLKKVQKNTTQTRLLRANLQRRLARVETENTLKVSLLEKAKSEFNNILLEDPNNLPTLYNLIRIDINIAGHSSPYEAKIILTKALDLSKKLNNIDDTHIDYRASFIHINKELGKLYTESGTFDQAKNHLEQAENAINQLILRFPDNTDWLATKVDTLLAIGNLYSSQQLFNKASSAYDTAHSIASKLTKIDPIDLHFQELLIRIFSEKGYYFFDRQDYKKSSILFNSALNAVNNTLKTLPDSLNFLNIKSQVLNNLGYLSSLQNLNNTCSFYKEATSVLTHLVQLTIDNESYKQQLSTVNNQARNQQCEQALTLQNSGSKL